MGPKQSQTNDAVNIDIYHPKFALSKLVKENGEITIETTIGCDQKQFDNWQKKLNLQKDQKQHLLIPKKSSFSSTNLCGAAGTTTISFPYYPYLLSQQIEDRSGPKLRFQEKDLWYLLFSLASARQQIQGYGFKIVGDIRQENIFLNDIGKVKISNLVSWPNQLRAFQKALDKQSVNLAPQQFQRLINGQGEDESNTSAQVFSTGLTLLNAGSLSSQNNCRPLYDYRNKQFNEQEFYRRVNEWISVSGYSEILKATVLNLVALDLNERLSQKELWDYISPHQTRIQARENFVINNAPNKIHQEVKRLRQIVQSRESSSLLFKGLDRSIVVKHDINQNNPVNNIFLPSSQIGIEGSNDFQSSGK